MRGMRRQAVLKIEGQIADMKDRPGAESDGPFDGVFEFAHVARPIVGDQAGHRVFGNRADGAVHFAELFEEGADKQRNIALALQERQEA